MLVATGGTAPAVIGIVLAGGRGRRMGGIDKGFLDLAGKPLIRHVIERIAPQVAALVINANGDGPALRALGLPIVADRPRPVAATGPLVGLASVFAAIEEWGDATSAVLSVPVDTPFLPRDLVARLGAALAEPGAAAAYAATRERDHPIVALWDAGARHPLRALLEHEPTLSLHAVMERLHAVRVVFDIAAVDPFLNINTAGDLAAAARALTPPPRSEQPAVKPEETADGLPGVRTEARGSRGRGARRRRRAMRRSGARWRR